MLWLYGFKKNRELVKYLSRIASKTIYDVLNTAGSDIEHVYEYMFFPVENKDGEIQPIFRGMGRFYTKNGIHLDDDAVGKEIIARKIARIKEKMLDEKLCDLDPFEYYVVYRFVMAGGVIRGHDLQSMSEKEKLCMDELMQRFGMPEQEAKKTAIRVHRIEEMMIYDDEETNMVFHNSVNIYLFDDGFLSGIRAVAGMMGWCWGFGYDEAAEILTDIGLKPQIGIIGTREASRYKEKNELLKLKAKRDAENQKD